MNTVFKLCNDINRYFQTSEQIRQVGLRQTKQFLHGKGNIQPNKKGTYTWQHIIGKHISDKGSIAKLYKE